MAVLFARLAVFQLPRMWVRLRANLSLPDVAFPGRLPKPGLPALLVAVAVAAALKTLASPTAGGSPQLEPLGWLTPPDRPSTVSIQATNGVPYRVPETTGTFGTRPRGERSGLCWAAELPCTGHPVDTDAALPDVVLRDPSTGVAGGFKRSENVSR